MRHLCLVVSLLAMPLSAAAQHSFSLPPIGGPLPPIGLPPTGMPMSHWQPRPPAWDIPATPSWERNRPPSWDKGRNPFPNTVHQKSRGFFYPTIVYVYEPYPVQPQVVVVERPVERIVEVEVPARSREPERDPEPPFVPTGDRIVYVIPGCYVGNVPPREVKLPATCDLAKLTTFTP